MVSARWDDPGDKRGTFTGQWGVEKSWDKGGIIVRTAGRDRLKRIRVNFTRHWIKLSQVGKGGGGAVGYIRCM